MSNNQSIMVNTPEGITYYRLAAMKGAIKLEARGMKMSRGVNVTAMARKELGLKARAPHAEVIAALEAKLASMLPTS